MKRTASKYFQILLLTILFLVFSMVFFFLIDSTLNAYQRGIRNTILFIELGFFPLFYLIAVIDTGRMIYRKKTVDWEVVLLKAKYVGLGFLLTFILFVVAVLF